MKKYLASAFFALLLAGCEPKVEQSGIPNVPVNVEINLNDIDMQPLSPIGGYVYINGGVRGIIVMHESLNVYRAFDRNCTFQPADACAVVEMHTSGFYLEDTCCQSTFDLSGYPTGGPAAYPLKEYKVSLAGDFLYIYNN